jgi:alanine transaminase
MNELGAPYNQMELVSLNSASKGFLGECGLRGGYMELANFQPYALNCMYKLRSIDCCSNTIGQLLVELMTNPPKRGVNSDAVVDLHEKELNAVFKSMKLNADALTQKINNMEGLSTVPVQGAMYAFPKIEMPLKAKEEAARRKIHPDLLYCFEALNNTGITLVPGAGFGQKEGTNHFRITNLVFDTQEFSEMLDQFAEFNSQFQKKYK